jgi:molybdenum cofactor synthesis domain-containing protein
MRAGILTISDRSARGERADTTGPAIAEMLLARLPGEAAITAIVPDEAGLISATLIDWADRLALDLILTTGGTGFAPRDVTPEATRAVIQRETPGIPEALRAASLQITPHAMLSRAVAGIRGRTLIVNLPGNPKAVRENLDVLIPILPHALAVLQDAPQAEAGHREPQHRA